MMRTALAITLLLLSLAACRSSRERLTDSGYELVDRPYIFIDVHNSRFEYDLIISNREYAGGHYYFLTRDSVVFDAKFDPLSIPYAIYHNASAPVHINAPSTYLNREVDEQERSVIRCPEPGRCRVVLYAFSNMMAPPRHDSLSTELFDVVGDETILTRVGYNDWYRISLEDTVRVLRTFKAWEFGGP